MDWNLIKLYLAIYRKGTITQAAKDLQISEPTLFRRLHDYEKQYGKLFIRQNGHYQLSRLGQLLLTPALEADKQLAKLDSCLHQYTNPESTTVTLTAPTSFAYLHLPEILKTLQAHLGTITIKLVTSNQPLNLDKEQADIALRVTDQPPNNYIAKKIAGLAWGAFASSGYLKAQDRRPEHIEQLQGLPVITPSGELLTSTAIATVTSAIIANQGVATDDLVTMAELAKHGHGIALLPDEFQQPDLQRLFTVKALGTNHLWLLTHPESRKLKHVSLVARLLSEALKLRFN